MDLVLGRRLRELPGPVMVTGHTGFKGSWLTFLLEELNVPVVGFSLPPKKDSLFERAERTGAIPEVFQDIRSNKNLLDFMAKHQPSAVIHMAAQPLVLESYVYPRETFETNVMGTVNVLDSSFKTDSVKAVIVVTTDKVYRNDNSGRPFIESDPLSGKDPYSASKVGTESVVAAWQQIAKVSGGAKVISVRAGNVIGGGDFSANRLLPDIIRGLTINSSIQIRNPDSTRPWQHVLDPLSGYLKLLEKTIYGSAFIESINFGPEHESLAVEKVLNIFEDSWAEKINRQIIKDESNTEAQILQLDSSYARNELDWTPKWTQENAVRATAKWWDSVINLGISPLEASQCDIRYLLNETE
jgi:CDP-glucose 4,6-dehydratase